MKPPVFTDYLVIAFCCCLWATNEVNANEQSVQTGAFDRRASIIQLVGDTAAQAYQPIMPVDEPIEWEIYVSPTHDPAKPAGLLVYISPTDSGQIRRDWKSVMDDSNLIWIAANHSGNRVNPLRRVTYAVMAVAVIANDYKIDKSRVYVSGFSGGGRIASIVATEYAAVFKGAIYNCGVNFWEEKTEKSVELIKNNRFVFLTGSKDFNLRDTKRVFSKYEKAGVEQIKLTVIPFMGHSNPRKKDYAEAISFLDKRD